jgi:small-conductance mechanosensitive channel
MTHPAFGEMFLGRPLSAWLVALAIGLGLTLALYLLRPIGLRSLRRLAQRLPTQADDHLVTALERTRGFFFVAAGVYAGGRWLVPPPPVRRALEILLILATLLQIGIWAGAFLTSYVEAYAKRRATIDPGAVTGLMALRMLGLGALWVAIALVALDNVGVNVTAFVAGLGITGVAVALAVQNVLGDLFASISIVLDKPFVVGDFIAVGADMGTVERVGLKTTRVRTPAGEQLVFANNDLLKSRVRNVRLLTERRVIFTFSVAHGTPPAALDAIPEAVRQAVDGLPEVAFERAHLKAFGPQGELVYEVAYVVRKPDNALHLDRQQAILSGIYRRLHEMDVALAHPGVAPGGQRPR